MARTTLQAWSKRLGARAVQVYVLALQRAAGLQILATLRVIFGTIGQQRLARHHYHSMLVPARSSFAVLLIAEIENS